MQVRILSAADVRAAIDMPAAIETMRSAFTALSAGEATVPVRLVLETPHGTTLFMPAYMHASGATGAKVVSVNVDNPSRGLPAIHAVVLALEAESGRVRALMDGTWLTALRTGAAGGLAADVLSRPDASVVAIFGAGVQARTQLEAVRCVRAVSEVRIVDPVRAAAERFASELDGVEAWVAESASDAVRGADIVVTATTSGTPVFPGSAVEPGTHVTGVGSYTPETREVDADLIRRARVVVDQREAVLAEAGDLIIPIGEGIVDEDVIKAELGEVIAGLRPGRESPDQITFFKSVGNAVQDVTIADKVLASAARRGLGTVVDL
jgi:ornithine cyclodeaminase